MIGILAQVLIEFAAGDEEEHSMDALEHLYPLVALIPLSAHIVHAELLLTAAQALRNGHAKADFRDAGGDLSAVQNIFRAGNVVDFTDSFKVVEEAEETKTNDSVSKQLQAKDHAKNSLFSAVQQREFIRAIVAGAYALVCPQCHDMITVLLQRKKITN